MSVVKPISLNGGIYLQSTEYNPSLHVDSAHVQYLKQMYGEKPTHLGVVEYFITSGFLKNVGSIFDFGGIRPEIIDVQGGVYTWETPEALDEFYIVEDLSCTDYAGRDEQPFKIRMNRRAVGNTAVISHDPYSKFDLFITPDEILQDGDTWVYTVTLKGQGSKDAWFPKEFLKPGTRFMQKTSVNGDTSTIHNNTDLGSTKMAKFYNYVGQSYANYQFVVGGGASGKTVPNAAVVPIKKYKDVLEMHLFKPGSEGFDAQLIGQNPLNTVYKGDVNAMKRDRVLGVWVPAVEAAAKARIELDLQNEAFWGTGGTVRLENNEIAHMPIGLYHQLNRGNQHYYSIENLTLNKLDGILSSFFAGRQEPWGSNVVEIETGNGGMSLVKKLTQSLPNSAGLVIDSKPYLTGDPKNLHYTAPSVTSFDFTFGTIKFKVNPALDPINVANEISNPKIGAFRLSSYMFIIIDCLGKNDNIKMLRNVDGWDYIWSFENGQTNYMGNQYGFHGRQDVPWDFKVRMKKRHYAYWLQDPTRCFILKPYNPMTKKPFGEI